jgi:hypothetical protein
VTFSKQFLRRKRIITLPGSAPSETTTVEIPIDPEILHKVPPLPDLNDIKVVNLTSVHNTLEPNYPITATT